MKVSITHNDNLFSVDVSDDLELENLKALIEFETNIPSSEITLLHNGVLLTDLKRSLKQHNVADGDILVMTRSRPTQSRNNRAAPMIDWSNVQVPGGSRNTQPSGGQNAPMDGSVIRQMLLSDPYQRSLLRERNPALAEALDSGDERKFMTVFNEQRKAREERERLRMRMLTADPMDLEAQQKIAEEIQLANINANMETAMEHSPESFGQVVMLYINCQVNGQPVKAFVDSGAQMTIMSVACAERCNIMRLVDRRWAGVAKGVGTQRIIGRVHVAQIKIEDVFLASSFSVLEAQPMDMLLGLDMLKRHQCCIDLKNGVLKIGTTGTETRFLSESELPECGRLSGNASQEVEDHDLAQALTKSQQETSVAPSSQATALPAGITEAMVEPLVKMGLKREDIIKELSQNGGDLNKATAVLLARSLNFKMN